MEFKVTSLNKKTSTLDDADNYYSSFSRKDTSDSAFPEYDFEASVLNVETDGKNDYSFFMNMMNKSDQENIRPIHANIINPSETNIDEGSIVSGKGYFVASKYFSENYFEYGQFYSED